MKYAVEMSSGVMIYIPSFIKIGSVIQNLMWGDTQKYRQHGDHISLLSFFRNKESGLKMNIKTEGENYKIKSRIHIIMKIKML
jgi:hypothetical protein